MDKRSNNNSSCSRFGDSYKCPCCQSEHLVKNGKTKTGKQRYSCKKCNKRFIINYSYNAYKSNINQQIILFTKEGLGIRSTARVLRISVTTLLKQIITIAEGIQQPPIAMGTSYEVDENLYWEERNYPAITSFGRSLSFHVVKPRHCVVIMNHKEKPNIKARHVCVDTDDMDVSGYPT